MIDKKNNQAQTVDDLSAKLNTKKMEIREAELKRLYGSRWDQYREDFAKAREFENEFSFPIYIMLEQTYRCNLACPTCVQGHEDFRGKYQFGGRMPWDLFERIVLEGEEHGLPSLSTHNNDEPLLVKDLAKRIKFARNHGVMDVIMTTNGLLFTEDKIKEIIDSGVTRILFSIDAHTEKTYDIVRPRRNKNKPGLEKVKWALEKTLDYREKSGLLLPIIRVALVISIHNQHEVYDFIKEWIDVVDYVDIQCLLLGGVIHHDDGLAPSNVIGDRVEDFRCNSPWGRMVIRGNGDVIVCENFQGADTITGNVNKDSIYEIYNNDFTRRLRSDGRDGTYKEPACIECANNIYTIDVNKYLQNPPKKTRGSWGLVTDQYL
jgi:radical SAM protein with 4Fe4S-binding SPASM domain